MHEAHSLEWHVASNIRAAMGRRNIRQQELARRLEMTHWQLSRRLQGNVPFPLHDVERIAKALQVPVWSLLTDASDDRVA